MRFTSFTAVFIALVAFGSTSVLANGSHAKASSSQEAAVTVLRRYMDETGYSAREVMDKYELFRRTGKVSKLKKLSKSIAKGTVNNAGNIETLANAFRTFRGSSGGGNVDQVSEDF
ncbi:hypothetical protein BJ165DRAFT_1486059 [Panaeolus papilionaceus]|nr:hypothetical protein BJ165DRAFT_1486059 [Panaeolus papilionaceus]